jgi:A118 family predicted phage portal protein
VEYLTADKFIPVEFDTNGRLIKVIFVDSKKIADNMYYVRFERHELNGETLTITHNAYRSTNLLTLGGRLTLDSVPEWATLPEIVTFTGVKSPLFGYFVNSAKNTIDDSPCGISVFHSAIDTIKRYDEQFARLDWEFESGERAIHVDDTAIRPDGGNGKKGKPTLAKFNSRLYRSLDLQSSDGKDELIKTYSPEFRDQSLIAGLNRYLRAIEFAVGLSYGDLSDISDVEKTAAEVKASKLRKYNTVNSIQANLRDCLEDLVYALAFYNRLTASGYEFVCDFKDSILTDEETEIAGMREDVAAGIIKPEIYIAKKYVVPEDEARGMMPQAAGAEV